MDSEIGSRHDRDSSRRVFLAIGVVMGLAGLVLIGALTARVALVYPVSSDDATGILEAASVLRGNVLLQGWTVSNISFVMTDLPFYVAGVAIRGIHPSLLRDVPSAVYAIAVAMAAILAASAGRQRALAAAAVLVLLGLPAGGLAEFVTKGYTRVGTSIGLFAALLALEVPAGKRVSRARLLVYSTVIGLTLLSDTYMMVIAVLAILAICLLGMAKRGAYENLGLIRIAAATVSAVILAQVGTRIIGGLGGFGAAPLPLKDYLSSDNRLRMVIANAWALAVNLPSLYRCDFPAGDRWFEWMICIGCMAGPALLAFALWQECPLWRRRTRSDFAGDVLWVSMLLGLAAFLASANQKDRGTLRYMVPFVLSGAVLTGRALGEKARSPAVVAGILALLGSAYGVTVSWDLSKPPVVEPADALARWLDTHDLRHGFGPYWDASLVTVYGRGRVAVRPVRGRDLRSGETVIEPFRWMSDESWYRDAPAHFVVYKRDPTPKFGFLINEYTCLSCFGAPSAKYTVGPYTVLTWNNDLRPRLVKDLPWIP